MTEQGKNDHKDDVYSKSVRAGRRTYFFDVKSTKNNDFFIAITESKKIYQNEGTSFTYEKHKIFLYQEDFEKFSEGLQETLNEIKRISATFPQKEENSFTEVSYEDLDNK